MQQLRFPRLYGQAFQKYVEEKGDMEEADVYRKNVVDQVYTFERWNKHRGTARYARHLLYMFSSRVFRSLLPPVLLVMLLAVFVGLYETLLKAGALPGHWPHLSLALGQAWNLTGFALSLLLAFRTNHAYDRWWEARKIWGGVVNRTRDIVRQGLVFFRPEDVALKEILAKWAISFPKVLMCHLRESGSVQQELQDLLAPEELRALLASAHRPNFAIQMMAETCRQSKIDSVTRMRMDVNLSFFEDAMGSCERILRTPIPLSYTRHTSRFLLVWLIMLPFTLWAAYSWTAIVLSGIFGFLMLGIDEIGVQIEEPFGVLPLEAISGTIERNIRELLSMQYGVQNLVQNQNPMAEAVPSGQQVEFGQMTGASPVKDRSGQPGSVAVTASTTEQLLRRSVDVERRAVTDQYLNRAPADYIEIELGSGGDTWAAFGSKSTYATTSWLQD